MKNKCGAGVVMAALLTAVGTPLAAVSQAPPSLGSSVKMDTRPTGSAPQAIPASYTVVKFDLPPGFDYSHINDFNNFGQAVGSIDATNRAKGLQTHAALWNNGVLTDLGTLGGKKCLASGINDAGDIVGTILTNGQRRAFLRLQNGTVSDLGMIDDDVVAGLGYEDEVYWRPGIQLNNLGQVTGHLTVGHWDMRAFILDHGQTAYFGLVRHPGIVPKGRPGYWTTTFYPNAINNSGQILGSLDEPDPTQPLPVPPSVPAFIRRPMLWKAGELIDLGGPDRTQFEPKALNDHGSVVGSAPKHFSPQSRAVLWEHGTLRWLNPGQSKSTWVEDINNAGLIVGRAKTASGQFFACLWKNEEIIDLNALVALEPGWRLTSGERINDRGQIVAVARAGKGKRRLCLLNPSGMAPKSPVQPKIASAPSPEQAAPIEPFNLTSFGRLPDGATRLTFAGTPDGKYIIEASTNLVTWTQLGLASNSSGKVEFEDPDAANFTLRFYRAVLTR